MSIPRVGNMYSAVLELKNMRVMSLFQVVMSYNVSWPTQAKVIVPRAAVNQPIFFSFDVFRPSQFYCIMRFNILLVLVCTIFKNPIYRKHAKIEDAF